jgi:hypothetical protein
MGISDRVMLSSFLYFKLNFLSTSLSYLTGINSFLAADFNFLVIFTELCGYFCY